MHKAQLLIIKTGSSLQQASARFGDFHHWFIRSLGAERFDFRVVSVHQGEAPPALHAGLAGALITGSPAMVSHRHDWSEQTAAWLAEAHERSLPMLGVCYGHQLLAHALGGRVGPNPHGRRMGTLKVTISDPEDELLGRFSPEQWFQATHVEAVLDIPPGARVIAHSHGDPHHGLYFGNASWGLQFHPEFDDGIMECYIRSRDSVLAGEGIHTQPLLDSLQATPCGKAVLQRFADIVDQAAARVT